MEGAGDAVCTSINRLPDDCLFIIFHYLDSGMDRDSFGLTCRRWLGIQNLKRRSLQFQCSLEILDHHSLFQSPPVIYSFQIYRLLSRFQNLEHLSFSGFYELTDSSLMHLKYCGAKLWSLNLDCCFSITDKGISFVADGCPALRVISLYRCTIKDSALQALVDASLPLTHMNIAYCPYITDDGLRSVMQGFPELQALKTNNCSLITGVGLTGPPPSALAYLDMEFCSLRPESIQKILSGRIEFLNIAGLTCRLTGHTLASIEAGFASRLRILNLRMSRAIRDDSVSAIAKGCPMLQEWNLAICHGIRVLGWQSIGRFCNRLEKLHVNRCRNLCDLGFEAIRNGCKSLVILYMSPNMRVSSTAEELFKIHRGNVEIKKEDMMLIGNGWTWDSSLTDFRTPVVP